VIVVGILLPSPPGSLDPVVEIARRAADTGARTEIVGVVPPGGAGDRLLLELVAVGVGHATVTRSAAGGIEAADLDLALRYLPEVRAIVLIRPAPGLLGTAVAASSWTGATLVIVGPPDSGELAKSVVAADDDVSPRSGPIVLEPPATDADGTFAGFVAALAVRLDAGEDPQAAWKSTAAALAVDPV
jgi:hypothetical protein